MLRVAVTFVLLLLMLFGGAVWLLDLTPNIEPEQQAKTEKDAGSEGSKKNEIQELEAALRPQPGTSAGATGFDIARIDPKGISVFAGRGEPNSLVTITADGNEVGTAQVDENGEWTLTTEARIANPDAKLALFKAPPGSVPRVVGADPQQAEARRPAPSAPAKPQTAQAVTSNMLKSLEGMVASARTEAQAAATAPASPATTAPAAAPTATPQAAAPQTALSATPQAPAAAPPLPPVAVAPQSSTTTVPVPVTFVYNEANLTSDGRKAAALLLEYLQLKRYPRITLTGHADERGSDELNINLSRERLETVARYLREGGYTGQLDLIPKGKAEPYTGVVRGDFSQEDLWQLDRRVELVVSR